MSVINRARGVYTKLPESRDRVHRPPSGISATSASSAASRRPARRARSTCAPPARRPRCSRCSRGPPTPRHPTRSTSANPPTSSPPGPPPRGRSTASSSRLGVVALIVGAVVRRQHHAHLGSQRCSEIGLRRALGATKGQIRTEYSRVDPARPPLRHGRRARRDRRNGDLASAKSRAIAIPAEAWSGGIASAILIGALAGLMPAVRAPRMPPTVALRTV